MFCPKCGQEQAIESVSFCSRCGSKLSAVDDALAKRHLRISLYVILTACAIFGWGSFTSGPQYMQIRVIITLLAAIGFYLIFQHDLKHIFPKLFSRTDEQTGHASSATHKSTLPPAQQSMISAAGPTAGSRRITTAEIVQPPSITEHTTTLLDDHER